MPACRCLAVLQLKTLPLEQSRMTEDQKPVKLSFAPFLLPAEPFASGAGGRGNRKKTRSKGQTKRERGWVAQPAHVSVSASLPSEAEARELEVSFRVLQRPWPPTPHGLRYCRAGCWSGRRGVVALADAAFSSGRLARRAGPAAAMAERQAAAGHGGVADGAGDGDPVPAAALWRAHLGRAHAPAGGRAAAGCVLKKGCMGCSVCDWR